jgi:hypothetical protein
MTDYNDGNWHGWNGGDCPVHPQSEVVFVSRDELNKWSLVDLNPTPAKCLAFSKDMIAFRVVTPYVEPPKPRELWINEYPGMAVGCIHKSAVAASEGLGKMIGKTTRWIEVLE